MRKVWLMLALALSPLFENVYCENFSFHFDYSVFRDENNKVLVEMYYSFDQNELLFVKKDNGYEAGGRIRLEVINKSMSKSIILKEFKVPLEVRDTVNYDKNLKLTGQINVLLDAGSYVFKVNGIDFYDSSKSVSFNEEVSLRSFPEEEISMSTVQLSTNITKSSDTENLFYKNTLEVIPNPSLLFGNNLSKLFYYVELYNMKQSVLGDKYSIAASITNNDGTDVKSDVKNYALKSDSKVEFGSIDLQDLPSNKYIFIIKIFDSAGKEIINSTKNFYIYNSSVEVTTNNSQLENDYLLSEYPKMSVDDVDNEYNKAIYIMPYTQKEKYESLKNPDEKRRFMFAFWTAIAPYYKKSEYFERVKYSNRNFKSDYKEGWKTDRGRVYCIYGKYDDIERFPYEGATRAYEVWVYNKLQGGVVFIFIDMSSGYGDFVQVHSTAQNEISDYNWREKLPIK